MVATVKHACEGCAVGVTPLLLSHARAYATSKQDALTVAAMLTVQNPFEHPRGARRERRERVREAMEEFAVIEGDHITYLNVYNCFEGAGSDAGWCQDNCLNYRALVRAGEIRQQLSKCAAFHVCAFFFWYGHTLPAKKKEMKQKTGPDGKLEYSSPARHSISFSVESVDIVPRAATIVGGCWCFENR